MLQIFFRLSKSLKTFKVFLRSFADFSLVSEQFLTIFMEMVFIFQDT